MRKIDKFKQINHDGLEKYEVNPSGIIRKKENGEIVNSSIDRLGYERVLLLQDGKYLLKSVHRMVALTFLKPPTKDKNEVNHIDGDKLNNKLNNLEWVSRKENMIHASDMGLRDGRTAEELALKIRELKEKGATQASIIEELKISRQRLLRLIEKFSIETKEFEFQKNSAINGENIEEVYNMFAEGASYTALGEMLGIKGVSVRHHLHRVYGKEHINNLKKSRKTIQNYVRI